MPLDHGVLNIPGRTGTINRDLDRFKADQAAMQRVEAKTLRDLRVVAKAAVAAMTDERVAQLGAALSRTPAQIRKELQRTAHWTPALCLKALANDEV